MICTLCLTLEQLHGKIAPLAEGANLLVETPLHGQSPLIYFPWATYSLLAIYLILRYN